MEKAAAPGRRDRQRFLETQFPRLIDFKPAGRISGLENASDVLQIQDGRGRVTEDAGIMLGIESQHNLETAARLQEAADRPDRGSLGKKKAAQEAGPGEIDVQAVSRANKLGWQCVYRGHDKHDVAD